MRIPQLLRNLGIVALTTLAVIAIALAIHQARPPGYTAESVLVVPANSASVAPAARLPARRKSTYQGPGLAQDANALAVTFAGLIPDDQMILQVASRRLNRSTSDVQKRLTATNDTNTSLVRIRYKGTSRAEALTGATTIAQAVSGLRPVTTAIPPGALLLIRLPNKTTSTYTFGVLLGIAAVLGISLGLLLMLAFDRANPRVRTPREVDELLRVPVIATRRLLAEGPEPLLKGWHDAAERGGRVPNDTVTTVALVSTSRSANARARGLAAWLTPERAQPESDLSNSEESDTDTDHNVTDNAGADDPRMGEELEVTRSAPSMVAGVRRPSAPVHEQRDAKDVAASAHEMRRRSVDLSAVVRHDVLVMVIVPATPVRRLSETVELLAEFGRAPDGAIFADRPAPKLPKS